MSTRENIRLIARAPFLLGTFGKEVWYCIITIDPYILFCILLNCRLVVLSDMKILCLKKKISNVI